MPFVCGNKHAELAPLFSKKAQFILTETIALLAGGSSEMELRSNKLHPIPIPPRPVAGCTRIHTFM